MADQEPASSGNGSGENSNEPQLSILAQYIKDLSVENPSAPQVFSWQVQPGLDVQRHLAACRRRRDAPGQAVDGGRDARQAGETV